MPGKDLLVIRRNGELSLNPLRRGLVSFWCGGPEGWSETHPRLKQQGINLGRQRLEGLRCAKVTAIKRALAARRGVRQIARDLKTGVGSFADQERIGSVSLPSGGGGVVDARGLPPVLTAGPSAWTARACGAVARRPSV